ncbi:MAG: hypothetical protein ACYCRF_13125 [Acidithiobacillus sp.]
MTEEQPAIIVEYPEIFPISGALREVFTERLKTFFQACDTWSCSHDGSMPEKLLKLRREMQESIDYPPVRCTPAVAEDEWGFPTLLERGKDPESLHVQTLVSPEVRLSWKGLQTRSMEKLPPAVRDAGLDLASRVLGVHIHYGYPKPEEPLPDDWQYEPEFVAPVRAQPLCPFTQPGVISELTKNWSAADRIRLRHHVTRHVGMAAVAGLIVGMALGVVISQANMPHYGGESRHQHALSFVPNPQPLAGVRPSRSALIAPSVQAITPLPQGWIQPSIQGKGN